MPDHLLCRTEHEGRVVPHYLLEHDHPWLVDLLDTWTRHAGQQRRLLQARLAGAPPRSAPPARRRLAVHVLSRIAGSTPRADVPPATARAALFTAASRLRGSEADPATEAAASLGITMEQLDAALFADLPSEQRVGEVPGDLSAGELALRCNLALAQALVFRSTRLHVELFGHARRIVQAARLQGLVCTVVGSDPEACRLDVSGPFAIFRRTLAYGRGLASLVPLLAWCDTFRLQADCVIDGRDLAFEMRSGDPVFPSKPPRRHDSRLEARFHRAFVRLAPDWELAREPQPVPAGGTLVFPDFAAWHRGDPRRRWLVEIVGWWTPEYLAQKLSRLREAGVADLLLLVDADRAATATELVPDAMVVPFRRRVDAAAVLERLEAARARPGASVAEAS